jgi:Grx4 family monothiol glutaredoxin
MSNCTLQEITTDADFTSKLSSLPSTAVAVIYFHAPWAAPCKQMSTILSTLASTYPSTEPPSTVFLSLDAEELPDISEKYDVTAVPYIVLERGGQVLETVSGADASKVRDAVERHAGKGEGSKSNGVVGLPPAQTVTKPTQQSEPNGGVTKDLSSYAPSSLDAQTAPDYSGPNAPNRPTDPKDPETTKEELFTRLRGLVKAAPVMLFMKGTPSAPQCGFSRQTVSILREKGVRYGFFNILADDEVRQGLKEFAEWPTFPQLWVDGELVGGLDIVRISRLHNF